MAWILLSWRNQPANASFNIIQPLQLGDKLKGMGVEPSFVSQIRFYLTERPLFVRRGNCVSGMAVSSTGVPQGTVLAPFLFTLYTTLSPATSLYILMIPLLCHVSGMGRKGSIGAWQKMSATGVIWTAFRRIPPRPRTWYASRKPTVLVLERRCPQTQMWQDWLFFLRRLRSFDVCVIMLLMFYRLKVATAICWGGIMKDKDGRQ